MRANVYYVAANYTSCPFTKLIFFGRYVTIIQDHGHKVTVADLQTKSETKKEKFVFGDNFPRLYSSENGLSQLYPVSIASRPDSHEPHAPDEVFRANFAENRSLVSDPNPSSKSAGIFPALCLRQVPKIERMEPA